MGRRRKTGRDVNGILLLDKPEGLTSNAALQQVKRLYDARKAGHTGSLDPIATGLLPVCLGEATKMSGFLLNADKGYQVTVSLGVRTTSGDTEGDVVQRCAVPPLDETAIERVLATFRGPIEQTPPMHSAIKVAGQPLYKLAHQGISVERAPRPVVIHELALRDWTGDSLELDVRCSKGTYIRTLAEDIGGALGCGAHVSRLRRTEVASFFIDAAHTLAQLDALKAEEGTRAIDALLLPLDSALNGWPGLSLSEDLLYYLRRGQAVLVPRAPSQGYVKLYSEREKFIGVGSILEDGRVAPKRLLSV